MTSITRVTHQVRIPNSSDDTGLTYIDVEVLDSIVFLDTNGLEHIYDFSAESASPCIIDTTGDYGDKGIPTTATRISHIIRVTNPNDNTQFLDVELIDAVATLDTNGEETLINFDALTLGTVVDQTGSGLGANPTSPSKVCHIDKIIQTISQQNDFDGVFCACDNSDDDPNYTMLAASGNYTCIAKVDAASLLGYNSEETLLELPYGTAANVDATVWTTDSNGNKAPPKNTDPNPYVIWPSSGGLSNTGWLGASAPIAQGPLWWIKRINAFNPGPWYWYIPTWQPLDFSFFGTPPPDIGSWPPPGVNGGGFVLLPYYPMIWILSANSTPSLIPPGGSASLEAAIASHTGTVSLPNGDPPFLSWGLLGGSEASPPASQNPMCFPPVADNGADDVPNIWQLTGLPQPALTNPNAPYNSSSNPYLSPTAIQAAQAATRFAAYWNNLATAVNLQISGWQGPNFNSDTRPSGPPLWPFATPYYSDFSIAHGGAFNASITTGLYSGGIPLEDLENANACPLAITQLDPNIWDTTVFPPVRL